MELYKYISEIISANPIRLVFSNKSNKEYEYNKVKINFSKIKDREVYQIEKFTEKQVFHENVEKEKLCEVAEEIMKKL